MEIFKSNMIDINKKWSILFSLHNDFKSLQLAF